MAKVFAIVKLENYDFNHDIKVCAVTADKTTAGIILENEIEKEKDFQVKGGIHYDTENRTNTAYEAYNEGYESTDGVHIFITEAEYIQKIEKENS